MTDQKLGVKYYSEHCSEHEQEIYNRRQGDRLMERLEKTIDELKLEVSNLSKKLSRSLDPLVRFNAQAKVIGVVALAIFTSGYYYTSAVKEELHEENLNSAAQYEKKLKDQQIVHSGELRHMVEKINDINRKNDDQEQRLSQIETKYFILDERLMHIIKSIEDNTAAITELLEKMK